MKRFLLPLLLLLPLPALASDLKVATWNLNWLTTRPPATADCRPMSPRVRTKISLGWPNTPTS